MDYNKHLDFNDDKDDKDDKYAEYENQIIENSTICIFNDELEITYTNHNFNKLTGYSKNELTGKSLLKIQHNSCNNTAYSFAIETIKCGDTWKGELQIIHKNKQILWLDTTISPLKKTNYKKSYIAIFLNISEQKKLINDLKQRSQEQGLIAIFGQISLNNIPVYDLIEQALAVTCASMEIESGLILEINKKNMTANICTHYNTPYIFKNISNPVDIQSLFKYLSENEKLTTSEPLADESRFSLPEIFLSGDFKYSIFTLIGDIKNPFGIFSLLSSSSYEINSFKINFINSICNILAEAIIRQNMEKSLRHEKELSRKYIDVANIMIIAIDQNEKIILSNQKAETALGYTKSELYEFNFFDVFVPQEIRPAIRYIFHSIFSKNQPVEDLMALRNNVIPMINSMDQTRYIKWNSSLLYDDSGEIISVLSAGEDITEIMKYEQEQKNLEKQLHQAQKMEAIGTLAGGIAHDFNNILSSILGFSDLALENINMENINMENINMENISPENIPPGEITRKNMHSDSIMKNNLRIRDTKLTEYINYIQKSGLKAKDIISQLQSMNLKSETPNEATLLPTLLKGTLKMLGSAVPADINLNYHIDDDLPAVYMNASKLNQIVLQLLINARNALANNSDQGHIKVNLSMEKTQDKCCLFCGKMINGDHAALSVLNNSSTAENQSFETIFAPDSTDTELRLVAQIIHDSNGHILIETQQNARTGVNWTKVSLLFNTLSASSSILTNRNTDLSGIHNKHLMVVDDENSVASYLGELLKSAGFQVSVFCDAVDALASFHNAPQTYDLLITDQEMPALRGHLLAERMLHIRPDLPVILCAAKNDFIDKEQANALNISALLTKPLDSAELLHHVATQLLDS